MGIWKLSPNADDLEELPVYWAMARHQKTLFNHLPKPSQASIQEKHTETFDSSDKFVVLVSSSSNQDDSNVLPSEYEIEKRKTTVSGYIMLMAPRNIM